MGAKKTIAIVTDKETVATHFARMLCSKQFRILFVTKNGGRFKKAVAEISEKDQDAEVEIVDCAREGCWEADLIMLEAGDSEESAIADAIKDVAIQKVVISIKEMDNNVKEVPDELEKLLPHSKVVMAQIKRNSPEILLSGLDADAIEKVSGIFKEGGYIPKFGKN